MNYESCQKVSGDGDNHKVWWCRALPCLSLVATLFVCTSAAAAEAMNIHAWGMSNYHEKLVGIFLKCENEGGLVGVNLRMALWREKCLHLDS